MSDEQDVAEALDIDEVGDDPYVPDQLPGENFPPDRPMGSRAQEFADDGSVAEDDQATRARREVPEVDADTMTRGDAGVDLVADSGLDEIDDEEMLIADMAGEPAGDDMAAEIAAMHIVSDGGA